MSLQRVVHLWSTKSWSSAPAGSSISLPGTEDPFVNCGGKSHTTCWLAPSLWICSEVIQLQKQTYLQIVVSFSSVCIQSCPWLLEALSLPLKDHTVHQLWTFQCVTYDWSTQPQTCSLGLQDPLGSCLASCFQRIDLCHNRVPWVNLSRRLELE